MHEKVLLFLVMLHKIRKVQLQLLKTCSTCLLFDMGVDQPNCSIDVMDDNMQMELPPIVSMEFLCNLSQRKLSYENG